MNIAEIRRLHEEAQASQKALRRAADHFMELGDALALLPGVQPRKARAYLRELEDDVLEASVSQRFDSGGDAADNDPIAWIEPAPGLVLTTAMCEDLILDPEFGPQRITPRGADILLRLFEAGVLPTSRKGAQGDIERLRAYAASEAELVAQGEADAKATQEERERHEALVADPTKVTEDMFGYRLLNDIFIARFGLFQGSETMEIGGIRVTKRVGVYKSNSGKSQDSEVTFTWIGSDGEPVTLGKHSRYKGNRRNDAERNWGLPE